MKEDLSKSPRFASQQQLASVLAAAGLDAVVVQSAKNVWYLCGHPRVGSSQRPGGPGAALAVVTGDGESTVVVGRWHSALAGKVTWSEHVARFRNFAQSSFHTVADVLEARGLSGGRVGVEMDYVADHDLRNLVGAMPEATFSDIGALVDDMRIRHGEEQERYSRDAYERLGRAMSAGVAQARAGDSRLQVHNRIMREILRQGTDTGRGGIGGPGESIVGLVTTNDRVTAAGDVLVLDYTCSFGPYAARLTRTAVVGAPDSITVDRYNRMRQAMLTSLAAQTAEMPAADACRSVTSGLAAAGLECTWPVVGHGIALGFEDAPVLAPDSSDRLVTGAVYVLDPHVTDGIRQSLRVSVTAPGVTSSDTSFSAESPFVIDT